MYGYNLIFFRFFFQKKLRIKKNQLKVSKKTILFLIDQKQRIKTEFEREKEKGRKKNEGITHTKQYNQSI